MLEREPQVIKYPVSVVLEELEKCNTCLIEYLLDNADECNRLSDEVMDDAIEGFLKNVAVMRELYQIAL